MDTHVCDRAAAVSMVHSHALLAPRAQGLILYNPEILEPTVPVLMSCTALYSYGKGVTFATLEAAGPGPCTPRQTPPPRLHVRPPKCRCSPHHMSDVLCRAAIISGGAWVGDLDFLEFRISAGVHELGTAKQLCTSGGPVYLSTGLFRMKCLCIAL